MSELEFMHADEEMKAEIERRAPGESEDFDYATYGGRRYAFKLASQTSLRTEPLDAVDAEEELAATQAYIDAINETYGDCGPRIRLAGEGD